ncbi:MAG: 3-phosphoserine/phosphohydroxythreonine transaminase [Lentisphaerae bacterium]|jgi:phosphoserine aminotransferase|nr:3-phosphoserine/phosphohydroxythreonine transaminase [Lentisphaerota bacterium]
MSRIYNFSAGPAILPLEVLEQAQAELVDFCNSGMSIMEMSHRGKEYDAIHSEAVANLKELMQLNDNFDILLLQGGASLQFAMIPMNFLGADLAADYVNSGVWGSSAIKQARIIGKVNVVADTEKDVPTRLPDAAELHLNDNAAYLHITTNETISGAQWKHLPQNITASDVPLVADMSSDILSRPIDANCFSLIYAGAQKNLGPSGVTVVALRKDFAERESKNLPSMLRYSTHADTNSLYNTPPCYSIYILTLVTRWLKNFGLEKMFHQNVAKAAMLYNQIDSSGFYRGTAVKEYRSDMNVTFRLPTEELETDFIADAAKLGLKGIKGHRSVGGIRASIYNAFPVKGVETLVAFMAEFERRHG